MGPSSISAAQFDATLRSPGDPAVVLDVRSSADCSAWSVDAGDHPVIRIPAESVAANPVAAAAAIPAGARVMVLCTRGVSAAEPTMILRRAGIDAALVTGGMAAWARLLRGDRVDGTGRATVVQFRREARGCLSYLVVGGGDALVVDPAPEVGAYVDEAERHGAAIRYVLDTHLHADHLSGAAALVAATGAARLRPVGTLARGARWPGATDIGDGDVIDLGGVPVRVISLPGHTSDNTGVIVDEAAVVAGDSLFADAVARPDLEVGSEGAHDAARLLHRTIHERLLALPETTRLLPCHYPGGPIAGPIAPTLAEVRAANPLLDLDEAAFAVAVLADMPPRPRNYEEIIAVNRDGITGPEIAELEIGANNCAASRT